MRFVRRTSLLSMLIVATLVLAPTATVLAETITIGTWLSLDNWEGRWAPQINYCEVETGIELEYVHIPHAQYSERLLLLEVVGDTPDLLLVPPERAASLVHAGLLADVQPYIERDNLDQSTWFPGTITATQFQGITFGLPAYVVNYTYAYNIDLFEQAGLVTPRHDEWLTWDQVFENARRATVDVDGDGTPEIWGFHNGLTFVQVLALIRQAGGEPYREDGFVQFNSRPVLDAIDFTLDMLNNNLLTNQATLFSDGRLASIRIGSGNTSFQRAFDDDAGIRFSTAAGMMQVEKSDVMYVTTWSLPKSSKNPEAAWRYMKCMVSPEAQRLATERGVIPMRRDTEISDRRWEVMAGLFYNVEHSKSYPHHVENEYVQQAFDAAIPAVWRGEQAPTVVMQALDEALNAYLRQQFGN